MARSPHFSVPTVTKKEDAKSVLPKLNNQGNLLAGATARIGVGFLLNPFSVLKARFEACCATPLEPLVTQLFTERTFCVPKFNWLPCLHCSYRAIRVDAWIRGIVSTGCTIRWIVCPALRSDQARVEQVHVFQHLGMCLKKAPSTAYLIPSAYATSIHSLSAAAAGGIATLATHPFDVIKVLIRHCMCAWC
jgi:solute carrier family 25 protein 38